VATVLLVDDAETTREVLRLYAEGRGLEVIGEAENGREAVELAERLHPDAVILDQQMPEMTGLEAMRELQQRVPEAVVVFYSSGPRPATEALAFGAGARAYFEKDTAPRTVVDHVAQLLDGTA
jgi:two-component system, chemotaxis family, chemotaxis protein CheY